MPIPQKISELTKRVQTPEEVEQCFPGFLAFKDSTTEQQIPRPVNNRRRKAYYSWKEENTYSKDTGYG